MTEYTATTEEIRSYVEEMLGWEHPEPREVFDRWLAEVKREAAERGYDDCLADMPLDLDWKLQYGDRNPYRKE